MILHGLQLAGWKLSHTLHAKLWFPKFRHHLACGQKILKITLQLIVPPAFPFSRSGQNHHKIAAEAAACCSHPPDRHWRPKLKLNQQLLITCHLSKLEKYMFKKYLASFCMIDDRWRIERGQATNPATKWLIKTLPGFSRSNDPMVEFVSQITKSERENSSNNQDCVVFLDISYVIRRIHDIFKASSAVQTLDISANHSI